MLRISPLITLALALFITSCNSGDVTPNSSAALGTASFAFINVTEGQTLSGSVPSPGANILNATPQRIVTELRKSDSTWLQDTTVTTGPGCVINPCGTWDTTKYPDGGYFVRVTTIFSDGTSVFAQVGFKIANTAASLVFVNVTDGQAISGKVASPGGNILNATTTRIVTELRKSDATWLQDTTVTAGPGCVINPCGTWDTTKYPNGGYFVRVTAFLIDGRQLVAQRNFSISNGAATPPPASSPPPASPPPPATGQYATLPTAPQGYTVPTNAVLVTNTADFIKQFTSSTAKDIVLADGTYDNSSPVQAAAPHRVWAARVGGARLSFGLMFESNFSSSGAAVHGLVFDITSASKTSQSAAIRIANPANSGVTLEDISINGNRAIAAGVQAFNSSGLVIRRCIVSNMLDYGLFINPYGGNDSYSYVPSPAPIIEDCDISNVYRSPRASNYGRSEACLWMGVTATVNRVRLQNCGWMGLWTGTNVNNARFTDLTVLDSERGVHIEHFTRNTIFERFQFGPLTGTTGPAGIPMRYGMMAEFADPIYTGLNPVPGQSLGASHFNTLRNGFINSFKAGIFTEDAEGTTVSGVKFMNQSCAGVAEVVKPGVAYTTVSQGNDFSGMLSTAVGYSKQHPNNCPN
jgi:hypothetical protein